MNVKVGQGAVLTADQVLPQQHPQQLVEAVKVSGPVKNGQPHQVSVSMAVKLKPQHIQR